MPYKSITISLCSFVLCFMFIARAYSSDVAIRAPVICSDAASCGEDINLQEARKSFEGRETAKHQLHSLIDHHVCSEASTLRWYYYWAPIQQFADGKAALNTLLRRARTGIAFDGYTIVESSTSTADEEHLALCRVAQIDGRTGPPRECVTVAIITSTETWLRGGNSNQSMCLLSASYRMSGAIDISFAIKTHALALSDVSSSILAILKSQFDLSAEQQINKSQEGAVTAIYIRSSGSLRDSKILSGGWREALDFDVDIRQEKDGINVDGTAHSLVCRQASGSLVNYQGPDDAQRATYAAAFDSGLDSAIRAVCKNYSKVDSKNLTCN